MLKEGESFVYTACPGWGDHDYCALKTIVKDGKIVRMEAVDYTGPEAIDGHICQKGCLAGRQPYDPKRLKKPLKRIGERGEGKWEEIAIGVHLGRDRRHSAETTTQNVLPRLHHCHAR